MTESKRLASWHEHDNFFCCWYYFISHISQRIVFFLFWCIFVGFFQWIYFYYLNLTSNLFYQFSLFHTATCACCSSPHRLHTRIKCCQDASTVARLRKLVYKLACSLLFLFVSSSSYLETSSLVSCARSKVRM